MNTERSGTSPYHGWNSAVACAYTTLYGGLDSGLIVTPSFTKQPGMASELTDVMTPAIQRSTTTDGYFEYGHPGWVMNVSPTERLPWAEFLADTRYASRGLQASRSGGARYATGVWRPTKPASCAHDTESTHSMRRLAVPSTDHESDHWQSYYPPMRYLSLRFAHR